MALTEFSTQESVETRTADKRIKFWSDKDGDKIIDPEVLTAAFQFAAGKISEYIVQRYGETEFESWTIDTAPARVLSLSDDLSVYYLATRLNSVNDLIQTIYNDAITTLEGIRDKTIFLYGATEGITGASATGEPDDPFSDRLYYNSSVNDACHEVGGGICCG